MYEDHRITFSRFTEIDFHHNKIRELDFYNYEIQPSPNHTFDNLKNDKNVFNSKEIEIEEDDDKIIKNMKVINYKTKVEENYISYYSGYPDSKINQFWNLYRYSLGSEIK